MITIVYNYSHYIYVYMYMYILDLRWKYRQKEWTDVIILSYQKKTIYQNSQ